MRNVLNVLGTPKMSMMPPVSSADEIIKDKVSIITEPYKRINLSPQISEYQLLYNKKRKTIALDMLSHDI